jgi:DNA-binding response OmpR family regulator
MRKVLIVDDENYADTLAEVFRRRSIEAITANSGNEGVEMYREHVPDCVFLDVNLPDLNGLDVFKRIKAMGKDPVVYFITGEVGSIALTQALELGAKDFLLKPVDMSRLHEIIDARSESLFPDLG